VLRDGTVVVAIHSGRYATWAVHNVDEP